MFQLFIKKGTGYKQLILDGDVSIVFEANEPLDFTFGKSHKTYTIDIPNVGDNNILLDNLFYKNVSQTLTYNDVYLKIEEVFIEGILYVYGFDSEFAQAQFVSGAGILWENISKKSLKEFDWTEIEHTLNQSNVINTFNGRVRYDFINRGEGLYVDDGMNWSPNTTLYNVDIAERQPAVQIKYILNKIFDGYEVTQNILTSLQYDNLYLLYAQNQTRNSEGWMNDAVANGLRTNNSTNSIVLQQSGTFRVVNSVTGLFNEVENLGFSGIRYQVPETGSYRIWANILADIVLTSGGFDGTWKGRKYNIKLNEYDGSTFIRTIADYEITRDDEIPDTFGAIYDNNMEFKVDSKIIELQQGRYIYINISYSNFATDLNDDLMSPPPPQTMIFENKVGGFLKVRPWNGMGYGSLVTGDWILPDITVGDFLKSLFKNFNVEFYLSETTKKIVIQNRHNVDLNVYDLTPLIIKNSFKSETKPQLNNYKFQYTEDRNDVYAKVQVEELMRSDGSYFQNYTIGSEPIPIQPLFSFNFLRQAQPQVIQMLNNSGKYSTDFNIRLAFYVGTLPWQWRRHAAGNTGAPNPSATVTTGIPHFENERDDITLSFADTTNKTGIYNKFYTNNILRINDGLIITLDIILTSSFISSINDLSGRDLRAIYYVNVNGIKGYYQIISIERINENIGRVQLFTDKAEIVGEFSDDFNEDYNI